jgi:hypothetical protein
MRTKTSKLLLEYFLAWQAEEGDRKTLKEFSDFIGINEKVFNHIFTGKREPTDQQTQLFAVVFRDNRFYEVTNRIPKDQDLVYLNRQLLRMDPNIRKRIMEEVSRYTTEPPPKTGRDEDGK